MMPEDLFDTFEMVKMKLLLSEVEVSDGCRWSLPTKGSLPSVKSRPAKYSLNSTDQTDAMDDKEDL